MSNAAFDRFYKATEIKMARDTLETYTKALETVQDAEGREFLERAIVGQRQRLEAAKEMAKRWWE
jgi:rubrerythrin